MSEPSPTQRPHFWPAVAAFSTAVALVAVTALVVSHGGDGDTKTVKIEYRANATDTPSDDPQECDADKKAVEVAVEGYYAQNGAYAASGAGLVPTFLRAASPNYTTDNTGAVTAIAGNTKGCT